MTDSINADSGRLSRASATILLAIVLVIGTQLPAAAETNQGGTVNCYYSYDTVRVGGTTQGASYHYAPSHVVLYGGYHSVYLSRYSNSGYNTVVSWKVSATDIDLAGVHCD